MTNSNHALFSADLQKKIDVLKARREKIQMGRVAFDSPLLLAPMASICDAPYRLLMQELGAGGAVSELISCHGVNYDNKRTKEMLRVDQNERNVGIQLFGEDAEAFAKAAKIAQEYGPKFIDINMGCPVKKVVTSGAGSGMMRDTSKLGHFFSTVKKNLDVPLTIKIRLGWDDENLNAKEILHIAREEGVEFVAIHGRTRAQQYTGKARWEMLEKLAEHSPLPIIGNGDLHTPKLARERMKQTKCDALMLGRGPLRNPFIFLEAYKNEGEEIFFTPEDHLEVLGLLEKFMRTYIDYDPILLIQMRKHIIWMAAGYDKASHFRELIFKTPSLTESMKITQEFFSTLKDPRKRIQDHETFMTSGHG